MAPPRSVRIHEDDLELASRLQAHRPSYLQGRRDIFVDAVSIGLRVLAAQTNLPGADQYGGLEPDALARELRQLLLPVFDFLAEQNELPSWMTAQPTIMVAPQSLSHVSPSGDSSSQPRDAGSHQEDHVDYTNNMGALSGLVMGLDDDDDEEDDD